MGTRGAYGFRIDNKDKVTYNHWDSYPSGLGKEVLDYFVQTPIERMREVVYGIILVDHDSQPTPALIEKYKKYAELGVSGLCQ